MSGDERMAVFMEALEHVLSVIIQLSIHILEFMGVATILYGAFRAVYEIVCHRPGVRLKLAESMALALEFKLGGEILRTVQVRDWSEIAIVGAIILLRGVLNLLIHHEIKIEEDRDERIEEQRRRLASAPAGQMARCVFPTPDPARTAEWYSRHLVFGTRELADGQGTLLSRDGMSILLTGSGGAPVRTNRELYGGGCDAFFALPGCDALRREAQFRGTHTEDAPGGFSIEDADGRLVIFTRVE